MIVEVCEVHQNLPIGGMLCKNCKRVETDPTKRYEKSVKKIKEIIREINNFRRK